MKKVFITGSFLMAFAAASYAQIVPQPIVTRIEKVEIIHVGQVVQPNTSTVNQKGNQQNASVMQTGSSLTSNIQQTSSESVINQGNYGATQQTGQSSEAYINQIGSKSGYVKIEQKDGGKGANTATVNQKNNLEGAGTLPAANATADDVTKANGNYASALQEGSKQQVTINQSDYTKSNKATVSQVGEGNKTSVSQTYNSYNNSADVVQGTSTKLNGSNSFDATATVEQKGGGTTGSGDNAATIKQLGVNKGVATIRQNGGADDVSMLNKGSITQTNDGNTGTIDQNNNSKNNEATVSQDGKNGSAIVSQSNEANGNIATLKQISGSGLKVDVQQSFGANRNTTTTNQYGTNSEISVEQVASSDNKTTINQGADNTVSSNNKARVYQKDGSQKGEITISQNLTKDGSANYAQVEQAYPSGTSTLNKATISQEGSRNSTRLSQTGTGNHMAMISQTGNNNLVQGPGTSLYEAGPMATQNGDGNKMTVSQTSPGGENTNIFNTANLSQVGMKNTIDLTQTANTVGNMSTISQMGNGNMATVMQMGGNGGVTY